ncbi:RNA polymerase sigma factor [Caproicibacterium amylolyticum]|uniref:Sigma-70 family RNA polymerase sigma factor n=1 Tax=Caproicibacterium amylolyticum TaxID=2766537 RepID=A0A7G9WGU7_9FIRM|nr:sigma factor-like helix-turn-helix DNA-binding protein [Caproicibacterium amylolyticum]QNO17909.1 sigma-70 family RNA polymerase sigma factor [Caproicibacterium amylolyticum]
MSKKYKTGRANRMSYIYYTSDGSKITLTPGKNGVAEADIELLHTMDDNEVDERRRFEYHTTHFDVGCDNAIPDDYYNFLSDNHADPENILLGKEDECDYQSQLKNLHRAMESLQPRQLELFRKVYVDRRTNTDIAAEEGVTEAAIRSRLKKMHEKLRKFFP